MSMIRLRGIKWQATVRRKGYPLQIKSFDLQKDAEKWARQQERAMDAGQWLDRKEAEQTTLAELLDRYAVEVSPGKRGHEVEVIRLNAMKRTKLAQYAVASVTGTMIAKYRDDRLKEVSTSTVTRELQLLGHVFSIAIKEWGFGLAASPVSLVQKPTPAPGRDRILTTAEREKLLYECGQSRNPFLRPITLFALETASRRRETLLLRWSEVDLVRSTVKFLGETTKTATGRTVPLSSEALAMLKTLPRSLDGRVFPMTASALQQAFERAVDRAGISGYTFHDNRHTALSAYAAMGLSVIQLCSISGHSDVNMLNRYVQVDAAELASVIRTKQAKVAA